MILRALVAAALLALPAAAHDAPMGWAYDPECCHTIDCAPVPDEAVREVPGGFRVTLAPGQHPMLPAGAAPLNVLLPYGDSRIRVSGDHQKHACISRFGSVFCIYLPASGS